MNVPNCLRWIRFVPLKLHFVVPCAFIFFGVYIGERNGLGFWNVYSITGGLCGVVLGILLQAIKYSAIESAGAKKEAQAWTETRFPDVELSVGQPWPAIAVIVAGGLVPGLPSLLMRPGVVGIARFIALVSAVVVAFWFFGPFWSNVLFVNTPHSNSGLGPFALSCVVIAAISVWCGFRDRAYLGSAIDDRRRRQGCVVSRPRSDEYNGPQ